MIEIRVIGLPAPQGSKRFMGVRGGKGVLVESSKAVKPWREAVKWAALEARETMLGGPLSVNMTFTLPKPKTARRRYPDRKPDLSKLVRSTEDALTDAGIWEDDARVVICQAIKVYAGDSCSLPVPGAVIRISEVRA